MSPFVAVANKRQSEEEEKSTEKAHSDNTDFLSLFWLTDVNVARNSFILHCFILALHVTRIIHTEAFLHDTALQKKGRSSLSTSLMQSSLFREKILQQGTVIVIVCDCRHSNLVVHIAFIILVMIVR